MKNFVQTGDNLSFLASQCVFPTHTTGDTYTNLVAPGLGLTPPINLVESGDPVVIGRVVGVSNMDALQSGDTIIISTRGVYALAVKSIHNGLSVGETVYIDPSTAVLSDDQTAVPFGVALGTVSMGATTTINVKLFGATPGATGANS